MLKENSFEHQKEIFVLFKVMEHQHIMMETLKLLCAIKYLTEQEMKSKG